MPQLPESLDPKGLREERQVQIEWRTISYRTVWTIALIIVGIVGVVVYFRYPHVINRAINRVLGESKPAQQSDIEQRQARFLNIDGTVRVKKANAIAWVPASPDLPLEKGDVIQTSTGGYARISFTDGAVYDMKPDTLVVVEENWGSTNSKTTNVSVTVTSGEVDLATTKFEGESRVMFANAVARIGQDSRASVKNDPKSQHSELTMKQGRSEVLRGSERVVLGSYEQVSFQGDAAQMTRQRVMGPPLLLVPAPQAPVVAPEGEKPEVSFSWTPVPTARSYRLRVSNSPIFANLVYDRRVASPTVKLALSEGKFYWAVSSLDATGKESQPSDASWFTLLRQVGKDEIMLELSNFILHGNQIEIIGRTEPGARVMVNDQPVFAVQQDGSFKHFTQPFASGANQITVTAQNSKGQIATRRKTVYIQ